MFTLFLWFVWATAIISQAQHFLTRDSDLDKIAWIWLWFLFLSPTGRCWGIHEERRELWKCTSKTRWTISKIQIHGIQLGSKESQVPTPSICYYQKFCSLWFIWVTIIFSGSFSAIVSIFLFWFDFFYNRVSPFIISKGNCYYCTFFLVFLFQN